MVLEKLITFPKSEEGCHFVLKALSIAHFFDSSLNNK